MKIVKKAEGPEIFPNIEFWKSLPGLVKVSHTVPINPIIICLEVL